jgi:hypothetical protein
MNGPLILPPARREQGDVWRSRLSASASETSAGTTSGTPGRAGTCRTARRCTSCRSWAGGRARRWCGGTRTSRPITLPRTRIALVLCESWRMPWTQFGHSPERAKGLRDATPCLSGAPGSVIPLPIVTPVPRAKLTPEISKERAPSCCCSGARGQGWTRKGVNLPSGSAAYPPPSSTEGLSLLEKNIAASLCAPRTRPISQKAKNGTKATMSISTRAPSS